MVISWPPSSFTIVMQSLTYLTDIGPLRLSLAASRLRSASISVTDPQHVRPWSWSSLRTCLVS